MKKNIFLRTARVLLALTVAITSISFSFTLARFIESDIMSNEIAEYHLISFQYSNNDWDNGTRAVRFDDAPAGEWAFFARGTHGRGGTDANNTGRPGVFLGLYTKEEDGFFVLGTVRGGDGNRRGGAAAYILDDMTARPATNPGHMNGIVVVAGGGGGRGGGTADGFRGGDAGGQTGQQTGWRHINGVYAPEPDPPRWAEPGFFGGFQGSNNTNTNPQSQITSSHNSAGGGGGAGVTADRATGGTRGGITGAHPDWFLGGNHSTNTGTTGGGGAGVWGGGGGALTGVTGRPGGGGSSFSAATGAVPNPFANPVTYRQHAINHFWDLLEDVEWNGNRGIRADINPSDGQIIMVWLGP